MLVPNLRTLSRGVPSLRYTPLVESLARDVTFDHDIQYYLYQLGIGPDNIIGITGSQHKMGFGYGVAKHVTVTIDKDYPIN